MKSKEDILKEIEIFSRGANGYSPLIIDILRNIERDFDGVEEFYIDEISNKFQVEKVEVLDTAKMLGIKILKSSKVTEIRVCLGQSCTMKGSEAILDKFKKVLGVEVDEITEDGKIKLTTQRCFGRCPMGPNVRIGSDIRPRFKPEFVESIVKKIKEN